MFVLGPNGFPVLMGGLVDGSLRRCEECYRFFGVDVYSILALIGVVSGNWLCGLLCGWVRSHCPVFPGELGSIEARPAFFGQRIDGMPFYQRGPINTNNIYTNGDCEV